MQPARSLTISSNGITRIIQSECHFSAGFDANVAGAGTPPVLHKFNAIWDTGASGSVITKEVVETCDLKPTGMVQTHHAQGMQLAETFLVNIFLPNGVQFVNVPVILGVLPGGSHALIGMDIITTGDFCITNYNGRTVCSFRWPSCECTDYVAESNRLAKKKVHTTGGFSGGHAKGRRHKHR